MNLDLDCMSKSHAKTGRPSQKEALFRSFIVMKIEMLEQITDLLEYLQNNLLIAYYCGFDITKPLPSYWTFERFIKNIANDVLKQIMQTQVLRLVELNIITPENLGLDSTPEFANTKQNNPKSFDKNKFKKSKQPKGDKDCKLGIHTASNQHGENNFEFYWGYKNHTLTDCKSGLPIYEMTTTAEVHDSAVALDILNQTNSFLPIKGLNFIADKAYDVKNIYNKIQELYDGKCFIPLNKRNTKNTELLGVSHPICEAGLVCTTTVNTTMVRLHVNFIAVS